jgi:sulfite reductase (NADPH) flavoprotein alpha-component
MNLSTRPPILEILPESAPFTPEQRTWLNGFFAGLLQLDAPADAAVGGGSRGADAGPARAARHGSRRRRCR